MNNKLNLEEIKYLIPDYIAGALEEKDRLLVDKALLESVELNEFYNDTKRAFELASQVKFEEPTPQYWNNLLPRIHEKIETRAAKKFSWDNISAIWKIIVPVAAVILFFVIYQLVKSPENQLTKKLENKEQKITNDSGSNVKNEPKEEKKEQVQKKEDNLALDNNEVKQPKLNKRNRNTGAIDEKLNKETEDKNADLNSDVKNNISPDEFALIETEESSILPGDSPGTIDEETEAELSNLSPNQKDQLLENLLNTNL